MDFLRNSLGVAILALLGLAIYGIGYSNGRRSVTDSLQVVVDRSPTRRVFLKCTPLPAEPGFEACAVDINDR